MEPEAQVDRGKWKKSLGDRGLLKKLDAAGEPAWYVRLYYEGKERRFGSFSTKTAARDFYEKAKVEQKAGRFFPERYHARHRPQTVLFRKKRRGLDLNNWPAVMTGRVCRSR